MAGNHSSKLTGPDPETCLTEFSKSDDPPPICPVFRGPGLSTATGTVISVSSTHRSGWELMGGPEQGAQRPGERNTRHHGTQVRQQNPNDRLRQLPETVFDATTDNARLVLNIDNARLAADDFRVKYESELAIRQSVEADIVGLRKVIDDTNMSRMNLESEIEALKEELIHLKKNHENEVMELRNQIAQSGVHVDVDAPKGQDLAQIMAEIRAKYEKMAQKNQEDLKAWHESQITEVQTQVTQNTEALKGAQTEVNDLRRQLQTLEIELESQRSLKTSLEGTLRDTEMRYNMEIESLNSIILGLEAELTQLRNNIQMQTQEYEALLNLKMKLEAEIATYRRLLDGGDFKLQDALEEQKTVKTKVMTVTQTLVDGKVVSSSTETKNL
ncbi:keratin, type I cytoskeletal 18-like protein [Lates japonicus]|uniref:Keratin, type I cytoskeletal 18-like protein n=1 Tax=Lates japonicus TaxID=270547 RepID=A0AAD3NFJ7_LATJO|nr:keratin, type I cytoskeletal 18-like protein [Lates japonicus]